MRAVSDTDEAKKQRTEGTKHPIARYGDVGRIRTPEPESAKPAISTAGLALIGLRRWNGESLGRRRTG